MRHQNKIINDYTAVGEMDDFRVLMNNQLTLSSYETPSHGITQAQEFFIVQRQGDYLMISYTKKVDYTGPDVLSNFEPDLTMYGVFLFSSGNKEASYMLVREKPADAGDIGTFFPVDGTATVSQSMFSRTLKAGGRHDNSYGRGAWLFDASTQKLKALSGGATQRRVHPQLESIK